MNKISMNALKADPLQEMNDFRKKRMVGVFVLWNVLFCFITFVAEAHRIRPAITSLYPQAGKSIRAEIQVNLEALIAGIGTEHQDTDDSAVSVEYNRLRAMPSAELQQVFQGFASKFMVQMEIRLDGRPAGEGLVQVVIAEQEDLELARFSVIVLELPISNGTSRLDWKMSPEFGDHVIRLMNREGEVVSTQWVRNGERSPPISLEGLSQGDFLSRLLEYMKIGFTHIFPKGLDHILFVLGLFLLSARCKPLLI